MFLSFVNLDGQNRMNFKGKGSLCCIQFEEIQLSMNNKDLTEIQSISHSFILLLLRMNFHIFLFLQIVLFVIVTHFSMTSETRKKNVLFFFRSLIQNHTMATQSTMN